MTSEASAGRRRLRSLVLGTAAIAALAAAGCGEKSEPSIHPPVTTAAPATTTPTATAPTTTAPTSTKPTPTPTAPVPKTTP